MEGIIEGLLYVQGDLGLTIKQIEDILEISEEEAKKLNIRINYLGNTIKLTTKEEHQEYYQKLLEDEKNHNLSQSALEVLAIIAYNEPITRGDLENMRGVDSTYVLRRLLAKGLIKECGKSDLPGRPILYKTTDDFWDYFGLASINDLPSIELKEDDSSPKDLYTSIYKEGDNNGRENNNQ